MEHIKKLTCNEICVRQRQMLQPIVVNHQVRATQDGSDHQSPAMAFRKQGHILSDLCKDGCRSREHKQHHKPVKWAQNNAKFIVQPLTV